MKFQWTLVVGLLFAIIIAVFAIVNVEAVKVNYIFGEAQWPLILIVLSSAFLGALVSGFVAIFRTFQSNHRMKELQKEIAAKELTIATQQSEIEALQKYTALPSDDDKVMEN